MGEESIDIRVRLSGARQAAGETKALSGGITGMGTAAKTAGGHFQASGRKAGLFSKTLGSVRRGVGSLIGGVGRLATGLLGVVAAYASFRQAKTAVNTTVELGKATITLSKALGTSVDSASEWAAVSKVRGISTDQLSTSFTMLAKNVDMARHGSDKQAKSFMRLGITHKDLARSGRDFEGFVFRVGDKLNKVDNVTRRAAIGQGILGRGYKTLLPLFAQGSKGLEHQMAVAKKYGATFGKTTVDRVRNYIKAQREAKFATLGLQLAIGTALIPILTKGIQGFNKLVIGWRAGTGAGGKLHEKFDSLVHTGSELVAGWKAGTGTGGELRTTLGLVAANAKDFAKHALAMTVAVAHFVGQHPELAKTLGVIGAGAAVLKGLKFGASLTGLDKVGHTLIWIGKTKAGQKVRTEMAGQLGKLIPFSRRKIASFARWLLVRAGVAGASAGGAEATAHATAAAGPGLIGRFRGRWGKFRSWFVRSATTAGAVAGAAEGAAMAGSSGLAGGGVFNRFRGVGGRLGGVLGRAIGAAAGPIAALAIGHELEKALAGGHDVPPSSRTPGNPVGAGIADKIEKFLGLQSGGPIGRGYGGGDRRLIRAEDGEFMVRKEAVRRVGIGFMHSLNVGAVPAMAGGGEVARRAQTVPRDVWRAPASSGSERPQIIQLVVSRKVLAEAAAKQARDDGNRR